MSTVERREMAVREVNRLLRIGGRALIYVWALEQKLNETRSNYISKKNSDAESEQLSTHDNSGEERVIKYHVNRTPFAQQDLFVPWSKKVQNESKNGQDDKYFRFYHLFKRDELVNLCLEACSGNICVIDSYYDDGNWCIIFEKTS